MERVGGYEIVRVIARGGMATVYEARQPALERSVALKRLDLRSDDPAAPERFLREARIAAGFDHPNIVTVFDFFECDGTPYIAMELLPRGSLRPWIGRITLPQAFGALEGILAGLAHAEERGVAHRDLKPENVLVTRAGGVKIADFGIAKAYTEAAGALTATGVPVGTPAYMAPEQATSRPVGRRTDLYAVGAIAYELLSGRPPFPGDESPMAVLYRHVNEPAPPLAGVDERVAAWVAWLLEKSPEARPPGAASAWQALEDVVVGLLGPYWRRHAPLRGDERGGPPLRVEERGRPAPSREDETVGAATTSAASGSATTTAAAPDGEPTAATRVVAPRRRRVARPLAAAVAAAAVAAAVVVVILAASSGPSKPPATTARHAAAPYDFTGDGRASIVAGLPSWPGGGAVALLGSREVLTVRRLGVTTRRFGSAIASADFDGDGRADLAVGAPGGSRAGVASGTGALGSVVVVRGSAGGLGSKPSARFTGAGYGTALAAADLDGDHRPDLAVAGARGVRIFAGGGEGGRARTLPVPGARLLAAGDVDGDGRADLVAAGPRGVSVCPKAASCRTLASTRVAALAVGDFTGDHVADVVAAAPARGAVEVWRGAAGGIERSAATITQDSRAVPGHDQPGDDFGAALALADVDGDGTLDLLVGAPGEDDGAGRVTMIRGGAIRGGIAYGQDVPEVPGRKGAGHRFGAALAAAGKAGATTLTVAAPGDRQAIVTLALQRNGLPGPGASAATIPGARRARQANIRLGG